MEWKQDSLPCLDRGLNLSHRCAMRPILVTPVNQRHRCRPVTKLVTPVEGRVAAADYDDLLAAVFIGVDNVVEDAAPIPRLCALLRKPSRGECPYACSDHDGPRRKTVGVGDQDEMPVLLLETDHVLAEIRGKPEL